MQAGPILLEVGQPGGLQEAALFRPPQVVLKDLKQGQAPEYPRGMLVLHEENVELGQKLGTSLHRNNSAR
jgi:hypothetical protein